MEIDKSKKIRDQFIFDEKNLKEGDKLDGKTIDAFKVFVEKVKKAKTSKSK